MAGKLRFDLNLNWDSEARALDICKQERRQDGFDEEIIAGGGFDFIDLHRMPESS